MEKEQKELLLQIDDVICEEFDLEMKDHWDFGDASRSNALFQKKIELIKQYENKYGKLKS